MTIAVDLGRKATKQTFNVLKQFLLETTMPIELKFHMKTPCDRLAKIYINCFGHLTKMVKPL